MKRVSWSSDIVEHTRTSSPPVISVGTFLAHLATHGTSQNTCMRALEIFSTHATIFRTAAYVAPYCTHKSLKQAQEFFYALEYPFYDAEACSIIENMTDIRQLNTYIRKHGIIKDRKLVYRWVLAYTRARHELVLQLIHHTQPRRH